MLGALILDNFKAFGTRQVIPLAPITLIFGANSAGKSAILQSLLLLKQSLDQSGPDSPVLLSRGPLIDLGSFQDMLFGHDAERIMEIAPLIRRAESDSTKSQGLGPKLQGLVGLGLQFGFDQVTRNISLQGLPCYVGDPSRPLFRLVPNSPNDDSGETPPDEEAASRAKRSLRGREQAQVRDLDELSPIWQELYGAIIDAAANRSTSGPGDLDSEFALRHARRVLKLILEQWQQHPELQHLEPGYLHDVLFVRQMLPEDPDERFDLAIEAFRYLNTLNHDMVYDFMSDNYSDFDLDGGRYVFTPDDMIASLVRQKTGRKQLVEYFLEYSFSRFLHDSRIVNESQPAHLQDLLPVDSVTDALLFGEDTAEGSEIAGPIGSLHLAVEGNTSSARRNPHIPRLRFTAGRVADWQRKSLMRLVYLGPLRRPPSRYYVYGNEPPSSVGKSGEFLPDLFFSRQEIVEEANRLLRRFGLGYHLHVSRSRDENMPDLFSVRLIDDAIGANVSMLDVGVGVSQVLPIVVESLLSTDQILLIEQPELHLHPRLQAELGSLFADNIGEGRGNQFIIETHSEHLVLRIQRLVREGHLRPSDVSVVYVLKGPEGSQCVPLRLDDEGDFIDEWPEGFFEEGYREMFA